MKARKRFGQHFLTDRSVLSHILACIDPRPADHLLEIGAGRGALTAFLQGTAERYVAIEIDRDLAPLLRARFPCLELIVADVLNLDFAELGEGAPWRVVGNLPYNISTPLLVRLLAAKAQFRDMHLMLQKELAERADAQPGTKAWGRLSVLLQYHCTVEHLFDVEPSSFSPPPRVRSSLVRLTPRAEPLPLRDPARLDAVLRTAFSARRKRLDNALKAMRINWDQAEVDTKLRPDHLSVGDFVRIANAVEETALMGGGAS